ncbi:WD repeat-containing protein 5-like [Oopsacas minuta]|uniref:WD repeat-containing protein 5-like n=1 Tax=Oopsacas minuta TaxID=111878 RepID=A0AAV7K538_9METZ|nr:WD repeat-containing protein 5-like [Oopsacas minuta]
MNEMEKIRIVAQFLYEHNYETTLKSLLNESGTEFVAESMVHKTGELELILDEHYLQKNKTKSPLTLFDRFPKGDKLRHILPSRVLWRIEDMTCGKNVIVSRLRQDGTLFVAASDALLYKVNLGVELDKVAPDILTTIDKEMPLNEPLIKPLTPIPTTYNIHKGAILSIDIHPCHPDIIVSSSMDRSVAICDTSLYPEDTNLIKQIFRDHVKYVVGVKWSPSGAYFASVGYDSELNVYFGSISATYDTNFKKVFHETHKGAIEGIAFARHKDLLATCCRDDFLIHLYQMAVPPDGSDDTFSGGVSKVAEINLNSLGDDFISMTPMYVSFSPDDKHILVSTDRDRLIILSVEGGEVVATLYGASSDGFSQPKNSWHESSAYIYGTSQDNTVCVWEVVSQKIVSKLNGHKGRIRDLQIVSYQERQLMITGAFDATVCIWC